MGCKGGHCNNYWYVTPCKNVDKPCGAFDNTYNDHTCIGHTDKRKTNVGKFSNRDGESTERPYQTGDVVENPDINLLRDVIQQEVNARKINPLYKNLQNFNVINAVASGDVINHAQQNNLASIVAEIAKLANDSSYVGDNGLGIKNEHQHLVDGGDVISAKNLRDIEDDLDSNRKMMATAISGIIQDCICYSDCTLYNKGGKRTFICTCYGYCCHYGWW